MKIKAIVSVTTSAIALCAAGSASAVPFEPWQSLAGATPLYMSGATAQDKGLVLLMRRLCANTTMTRVLGNKQSATLCEANGVDSLPIAAGTKLVLWKNSDGGSGTGVKPVADYTTLPFLNLASLTQAQYQTPATCTVTNVAATADFSDYKEYNCKTNVLTNPVKPDAGLSDVEPDKLGWASGTNGPLTVVSGPQVLFGVPVSKNFRDALQTAQGKPAGSDLEVNMPSLTKAQLGSIYTGALIPVNRLSDKDGNALASPPGSTTVQVCRRKGDTPATPGGSGTLASFKAYFLNVPCDKGSKDMTAGVDGDVGAPVLPASRVIAYSGTTGVLGCLNAQHTANKYAVGMASMETKADGSAYVGDAKWGTDPANWRYVKVSGYAPTLLNTVQTKYDFLMEATYQYRTPGSTSGPTLTVAQKALFDKVVATNSSSVVIKELNTVFAHSFGQSGLLGVPNGTSTLPSAAPAGPLTAAEVTNNPVNSWGRAVANNKPNSCQFPYVVRETGLDAATGFGPTNP